MEEMNWRESEIEIERVEEWVTETEHNIKWNMKEVEVKLEINTYWSTVGHPCNKNLIQAGK